MRRQAPPTKGWRRSYAQKVQGFIQEVLEEEVTALLGRRRWQRRRGVDEVPGYRNRVRAGLRKLSLTSGTVEVRRPRVRGLEERFESRILPLFKRRTRRGRRAVAAALSAWVGGG